MALVRNTRLLLRTNLVEAFVLLVAVATAIVVAITGHHGAKLTHIYGVGPQGDFLETH